MKDSEETTLCRKRIVLTTETCEAVFLLNNKTKPHSLQIICKELEESVAEWFGSFQLTDLQPDLQALFETIDNLYYCIGQNLQVVQMEGQCLKIPFNFLKQVKVVKLQLVEMARTTVAAQKKQIDRIRRLQVENQALKSMQGGKCAYQKLTLPHNFHFLHLDSYRLTNCRDLAPLLNVHLKNLFKLQPAIALPSRDIWSFQILISSFITTTTSPCHLIEIGIRNEKGQTVMTSLKASLHTQAYSKYNENEVEGGHIEEGDCLRVVMNMDDRSMRIERNYGESRSTLVEWKSLEGNHLWLWLRLYMVQVKTDLFVQEQPIKWAENEHKHKNDTV